MEYIKGEMPDLPPLPEDIPAAPLHQYTNKCWKSMGDWLGTGAIAHRYRVYRDFKLARDFARSLNLQTRDQWYQYTKGNFPDLPPMPENIPTNPNRTYRDKGWNGVGDWLGTGTVASQNREYLAFAKAREFVHSLNLKTQAQWKEYVKGDFPDLPPLPNDIPSNPQRTYKDRGWISCPDWLGKKKRQN